MIIDHRVTIAAPPERIWELLLDIPAVSRCVPGVERLTPAGADTYSGILAVRVGPVAVKLDGRVRVVERDREHWRAQLDVDATDRRIRGAVKARTTLELAPRADGATDIAIHTDAAILGKLGQFGQAVVRKKADQVVAEFAANMARELSPAGRPPGIAQ